MKLPSGIQGARTEHDQASMEELRSMFSEMKELLIKQVSSESLTFLGGRMLCKDPFLS